MNKSNVILIVVSQIYEVYINIYFVSECRATQPPAVVICQVVIEINSYHERYFHRQTLMK
jgi:hypothetical protein